MNGACKLITIGTGSGLSIKGKGGPAHLVITGDQAVMLDCGEGTAGALLDEGRLLDLNAVLLTHLHPDHISGLYVLVQNMLLKGRSQPLDIYLPAEGIVPFTAMRDAVYLAPDRYFTPGMFRTSFNPLESGEVIRFDTLNLRPWESDHFAADIEIGLKPRPAFGITLDSGPNRLVYTGDIGSVDCFRDELTAGCTLLTEAMHIDWADVAELAAERRLRQVIFTHCRPDEFVDLEAFCADREGLTAARDGMEFTW